VKAVLNQSTNIYDCTECDTGKSLSNGKCCTTGEYYDLVDKACKA